ncbi:hypothetical protein QVD17_06888 [Tagetes erecta]|uniref:Uncharacterized protein n=1 Tax=Tagetes erecta TaxID=13708 RepID=A0AAD8LGE4_TARER|nr:hypothetical protein QVD17_06888 [Tagetes erecta]
MSFSKKKSDMRRDKQEIFKMTPHIKQLCNRMKLLVYAFRRLRFACSPINLLCVDEAEVEKDIHTEKQWSLTLYFFTLNI